MEFQGKRYASLMILRQKLLNQIRQLLAQFRVVVLTGPMQVGKTTLARYFVDV